jgi:hypothetical protein
MSNKDDSIILDLSRARSTGNNNRYYCSYCNTRLTPLTREDRIGGYHCTKCTITYWPNQQPVPGFLLLSDHYSRSLIDWRGLESGCPVAKTYFTLP